MKLLHVTCLLALIGLTILISGCTRSSSSSTPSYYFRATVGSTSYSTTNASATITKDLGIAALTNNAANPYPAFSIVFGDWGGTVGTYPLNDSVSSSHHGLASYNESNSVDAFFYSQSGSVTITAVTSTSITGTFNFIGKNSAGDTRNITGGTFFIKRN